MIQIIPATPEMVRAHCPGKFSVRALAPVDGDRVLGIGGIYVQDSCQVVFSYMSDELKRQPRYILKTWRMLLKMIEGSRLPTLAQCDFSIPKADVFLLHLGFLPYRGDLWLYRGGA